MYISLTEFVQFPPKLSKKKRNPQSVQCIFWPKLFSMKYVKETEPRCRYFDLIYNQFLKQAMLALRIGFQLTQVLYLTSKQLQNRLTDLLKTFTISLCFTLVPAHLKISIKI